MDLLRTIQFHNVCADEQAAIAGCLLERPAYRQAQNLGFSVTETRFTKLNERANALIQALIDRIPTDG